MSTCRLGDGAQHLVCLVNAITGPALFLWQALSIGSLLVDRSKKSGSLCTVGHMQNFKKLYLTHSKEIWQTSCFSLTFSAFEHMKLIPAAASTFAAYSTALFAGAQQRIVAMQVRQDWVHIAVSPIS